MSKTNLLQRGMTSQFAARYLLVEVSEVAELTRQKHQLSPKIACLAAESIAASALMAAQIKGEERLTIQIQSEKPKFSFFCDLAYVRIVKGKMRLPISSLNVSSKLSSGLRYVFFLVTLENFFKA